MLHQHLYATWKYNFRWYQSNRNDLGSLAIDSIWCDFRLVSSVRVTISLARRLQKQVDYPRQNLLELGFSDWPLLNFKRIFNQPHGAFIFTMVFKMTHENTSDIVWMILRILQLFCCHQDRGRWNGYVASNIGHQRPTITTTTHHHLPRHPHTPHPWKYHEIIPNL